MMQFKSIFIIYFYFYIYKHCKLALDLSCMSLSCLDPVLLSEGLRKIRRIHLRNCWLTTLQIWEILDRYNLIIFFLPFFE